MDFKSCNRKINYLIIPSVLIYIASLVALASNHVIPFALDSNTHYFPAAGSFLAGNGLESFRRDVYRGPGYPLLLAFGAYLSGNQDLFTVGKVISVIFGIIFLFFAFNINRKLFSSTISLLITGLVAVNPLFVLASIRPLTDIVFAALAIGTAYFLIVPKKHRNLTATVAGVLGGYAYLVRYPGIFLLIYGLFVLLLLREWRRVGVFFLTYFLVITPWLIGNYRLHGDPLYTRNFTNLHASLAPVNNVRQFESLIEIIQFAPLEFLKAWMDRLLVSGPVEVVVLVSGNAFSLLAGVGLIAALLSLNIRKVAATSWWWLFPILYWSIHSFGRTLARLYIPLLPFIYATSLLAVFWFLNFIKNWPRLRVILGSIAYILITLSILYTGQSTYSDQYLRSSRVSEEYQYLFDIAELLKTKNLGANTKVGIFYHSRATSALPGRAGIPVINVTSDLGGLSVDDYFLYEKIEAAGGEVDWVEREGFDSPVDVTSKWSMLWEAPEARLYRLQRDDFFEGFDYDVSPLKRGWSMGGQSKNGEISITFDPDLNSKVLQIKSNSGVQFRADYDLINVHGSQLSFDIKFGNPCLFYIVTGAAESGRFIMSYPLEYGEPQLAQNKNSGIIPLNNDFGLNGWGKIERDVSKDLRSLLNEELIKVTGLLFRGNCMIDNIHIE